MDDGLIQAVSYDNAPLEGERRIDCGGQVLLPGFIDSHLHLPGSLLYRLHGVELLDCASLEDCQRALEGHTGGSAALRGFGWSQMAIQEDPQALLRFQDFLNQAFPSLPVALFSDDYHSCIVNRALLNTIISSPRGTGTKRPACFVSGPSSPCCTAFPPFPSGGRRLRTPFWRFKRSF